MLGHPSSTIPNGYDPSATRDGLEFGSALAARFSWKLGSRSIKGSGFEFCMWRSDWDSLALGFLDLMWASRRLSTSSARCDSWSGIGSSSGPLAGLGIWPHIGLTAAGAF